MPAAYRLEFIRRNAPDSESLTKFGGQPNWLTTPEWPLSRSTKNPMRFLGQIELDPALFPNATARVAYLFMTDEENGDYVDGTWEPDGGENAVILQPGNNQAPTQPLPTGPSLYQMEPGSFGKLQPEPREFAVRITPVDEDEILAEQDDGVFPNQIGGRPNFLQGEEFPFGDPSPLLLQLDSSTVPFYLNFGDAGIGYAFLNESGDQAKFLWQCG